MNSASKWNLHDMIDRLGASFGALVYRNHRLFGKSLEAVPLREAVRGTHTEVSELQPGVWQKVSAYGPAGRFDASYLPYRWRGFQAPTLLFIHASGEQPYDFRRFSSNSFRSIFVDKGFDLDVNLILLMAPFHEGSQNDYIKAMGYLQNYVGMLSTTAALLDALADRLRKEGCPAILAAGLSLGGWVVNLHRAFYGRNVDRYVTMIAGSRLSEVFLSSHYQKLTAESARANPELLKDFLDFEREFRTNDSDDCYPLLARYDRLVELETQRAGYEGMDLKILDKGHFTGMADTTAHRRHIQRSIT